jgi:hypothetical protein
LLSEREEVKLKTKKVKAPTTDRNSRRKQNFLLENKKRY